MEKRDVKKYLGMVLKAISAVAGSVVGLFALGSANITSEDMGWGDLCVQTETTSENSGTTADGLSTYSDQCTTAPSQEAGSGVGTSMSATGLAFPFVATASTNTTEDPIARGEINGNPFKIWEDSSGNIKINISSTPYSKVEKRAQQAYDVIHGNRDYEFKLPSVIIEDGMAAKQFCELFRDNPSPDRIRTKLTLLEEILRRESENGKNTGIHQEKYH